MENKDENKLNDRNSNLSLENRQKLILSGVIEVISFDSQKIDLTTVLGNLSIKGSDLKMNKLDVKNGDVIINGSIDSMAYSGKEVKKSKESIISRLFK
ncbi:MULTISPECIES: sporulation protein YabP [Clostridium]|uniref:Sporulation protein YabP n=1 Tax=Clostridium botulinum (strain Eklund 17B / Type B) TaxID=935198 RepID=B2TI18_CLOBB|nr:MULTISPECIES: sporulation protein YabP [Clostridium]ACD22389.1 sporulation protein YabP [Clostridium botulinum B str. Eklund 17B (NRP)]MBN1043907.1 sporulation protein YabP [Clostridium botulinum]MBN1050584.1 sporulation protein YabP [Clostridium botulinum]MBN1053870.1 sporulation protein YabP [Clostridium botulinum]MBY6977307.1 sporulation protein YabP [Clostridium botulinum]